MPKITKILKIIKSRDANLDFHYAEFLKVDIFNRVI